eukprot:CAMPEP_0184693238 /NCGR_PEP_ID=MMETSP0313-20130426/1512_1 /TAXON_ID=2792 /ORGANISM="Porphyridium aerugineum, Strain SAG 1380-2" /LENGTH=149 /DNA_ID=CAMNT_0027151265 /DNA_START=222 /DNA_END=668 /DNA_ORIENTATION=+
MAESKVKLQSHDGEIFEVDHGVASISIMVNDLLQDTSADDIIPIPNVKAEILSKVIEYSRYQYALKTNAQTEEQVDAWNKAFVQVDKATLFELILAANFLNIQPLLDLACKSVADTIKSKTAQQIRDEFGIPNDFTPEEEEQFRKDNAW